MSDAIESARLPERAGTIVVGAGLAGLSAALLLERQGVEQAREQVVDWLGDAAGAVEEGA